MSQKKVVFASGCALLTLQEPVCPDYINPQFQSCWMKDRRYRRSTFLFNDEKPSLHPNLAYCELYLAKAEVEERRELVISCFACKWFSFDLTLWTGVETSEAAKQVHNCVVVQHGPAPMNNMDTNFAFEINRLNSLLPERVLFPKSKPDYCYNLAKSGFYLKGPNSDRVVCHYCNLEAENWQADDVADAEHRRLNALGVGGGICKCPLMNGENVLGNIQIGQGLDKLMTDSVGSDPAGVLDTYTSFKEETDRLRTFDKWHFKLSIDRVELAKNFLICAGDERLICCKCDLAFNVCSSEAKPLDFHRVFSPNCAPTQ